MNKLLVGGIGLVAFVAIVVPGIIVWLTNERGGQSLPPAKNLLINVYLHEQAKIVALPLEDYLKGVLAAEMPAEFSYEALKAQAVAARTYAVEHMRAFGGNGDGEHATADVSTDFSKSQAWVDEATLKNRWGDKYSQYWQRISNAVTATSGMVIVYEGKVINAVFHSTSGERTASAKEVWGNDLPYLQSVECKWDQASPRYYEQKAIALNELGELLGGDVASITAATQAGTGEIAKIISRTESGRVAVIKIGSKNFTGQELRTRLGLRSENFTLRQAGQQLIFATYGYGHGVGLCQYGANGMAKAGKKYQEILQYYYTGVNFKNIYDQ